MSERRRLLASEIAFSEIEQWVVEASESTEHEEHSCISSRSIDCGRDIGDANIVSGTVGDVALVVAGSWMNTRLSIVCQAQPQTKDTPSPTFPCSYSTHLPNSPALTAPTSPPPPHPNLQSTHHYDTRTSNPSLPTPHTPPPQSSP